jgi:iron complex transport system ATP-binding protein
MQLLDEPTNHLDLSHRLVLLGMLAAECRDRRRALLMSLHDINLAARFCDHALLLLGDGETLHGPVASVLDSEILESLYGHPLIEVATPAGRAWLPA